MKTEPKITQQYPCIVCDGSDETIACKGAKMREDESACIAMCKPYRLFLRKHDIKRRIMELRKMRLLRDQSM